MKYVCGFVKVSVFTILVLLKKGFENHLLYTHVSKQDKANCSHIPFSLLLLGNQICLCAQESKDFLYFLYLS